MKIKITIEEIRKYLDIEKPEFHKYVATLINLQNKYDVLLVGNDKFNLYPEKGRFYDLPFRQQNPASI